MTSLKHISFLEKQNCRFSKNTPTAWTSVSTELFRLGAHSSQNEQAMRMQNVGTIKEPVCLVRSHFLNCQTLTLKEKKWSLMEEEYWENYQI